MLTPGKNANSYCTWLSYHQAIVDCEHNAEQKLEEVQQEYEDKQKEDVKGYTELLDQLSQTIANHNLQIDTLMPPLSLLSASLHQKEAELDVKAKALDTCDLKLSKYKQYISHWCNRLLYPSTYHHIM
jgi:hemerythrin